jgi:hypothetical protein
MYLLVTDETNRRPDGNIRFLAYGGLIIPIERLSEVDTSIRTIRTQAGYRDGDELKFDTRARPDYVPIEAATEAKRAVIRVCHELGCKFIAHVIHHDIIQNQAAAEQIHKAADYVIGRFNMYLASHDADGICLMDNLPDRTEFAYMAQKFQVGLRLPNNNTIRLERIKLYGSTCIGASHANSAMDIILGSFRYCINQPRNVEAAQGMLRNVVDLMWSGRNSNGNLTVGDQGLVLRPHLDRIMSRAIRGEYDDLLERLNQLLNDARQ